MSEKGGAGGENPPNTESKIEHILNRKISILLSKYKQIENKENIESYQKDILEILEIIGKTKEKIVKEVNISIVEIELFFGANSTKVIVTRNVSTGQPLRFGIINEDNNDQIFMFSIDTDNLKLSKKKLDVILNLGKSDTLADDIKKSSSSYVHSDFIFNRIIQLFKSNNSEKEHAEIQSLKLVLGILESITLKELGFENEVLISSVYNESWIVKRYSNIDTERLILKNINNEFTFELFYVVNEKKITLKGVHIRCGDDINKVILFEESKSESVLRLHEEIQEKLNYMFSDI